MSDRARPCPTSLTRSAGSSRRPSSPSTPTSRPRPTTGPRSDRMAFWAEQAERLDWDQKWDRVLDWDNPPFAKWFVGGKLNAAYNCVDRHVEAGRGDKVAFHWVGEPEDDTRDITYAELKDEVCQAANALTELGVETGDRVAIYLPMIPEAVVAMLACARIGAPHTVVFGGFSADALASRLDDCQAKVVITADGGYRRGAPVGAQAGGRRGPRPRPRRRARRSTRCSSYAAPARTSSGTTTVDVWWHDVVDSASTEHTSEVVRLRAPALRHVHLGHDRQAQGHPAHHRRLPGRCVVHALGGLRPQARDRRLLVHRRHRLGDRPLLHASTARSPTARRR